MTEVTIDYIEWLIEVRAEYGALLFVWVYPDESEQPIFMPGEAFAWWAEKAQLQN